MPEARLRALRREKQEERIFLVVVDETEEMRVALRYAASRAKTTGGRVALFASIEASDFGHWQAVDELIEKEARDEMEALMARHAAEVQDISGKTPIIHIRSGKTRDALLALIEEDPRISILVLAAGAGKSPGPLVSALTGKSYRQLNIPITIVPGTLSDAEIDALT